ncbi:MAG: glycosyltransferase family 2 protein [Nitrososphaerales archaeon]
MSKPEIIMVYNSEETDWSRIEQLVNEQLAPCMSMIEHKIIPTSRLPYYELKNFAAKHSHRDIIIFLDSDVIPEDGWLIGLLEALQQPEVRLVGGANYYPSESLYEKAIGLIHYGPRESDADGHIREAEYFPGGNVAFRRELFEEFPFPPLPHFRGRWTLMETVRSRGIKIYCQPKSRASHPAPNGVGHFVRRAVCDGHDVVMDHKCRARMSRESMLTDNRNSPKSMRRKFSRFYTRYKRAGLRVTDSVGVFGIVFSYISLMFFGIIIASIRPELIRRYFAI